MTQGAPVAIHGELFRYWDRKRVGREMPSRTDVSPAEIKQLLPYLMLIDVLDSGCRFRLVGSGITQDVGRELTGTMVGSNVSPPEYAKKLCEIYERVAEQRRPLFAAGEYRAPTGNIHSISRVLLPLGPAGGAVNMLVLTRVARFNHQNPVRMDWMGGATGHVVSTRTVASAEEVDCLAAAWEASLGVLEAPVVAQ